jgi:hypothetical protein
MGKRNVAWVDRVALRLGALYVADRAAKLTLLSRFFRGPRRASPQCGPA